MSGVGSDDNQRNSRCSDIMKEMLQLLSEWELLCLQIKKLPKHVQKEMEEFVKRFQCIKIPETLKDKRRHKKRALTNLTSTGTNILPPIQSDPRCYSKVLEPPPKQITEKRSSLHKSKPQIGMRRRQTVGCGSDTRPLNQNPSIGIHKQLMISASDANVQEYKHSLDNTVQIPLISLQNSPASLSSPIKRKKHKSKKKHLNSSLSSKRTSKSTPVTPHGSDKIIREPIAIIEGNIGNADESETVDKRAYFGKSSSASSLSSSFISKNESDSSNKHISLQPQTKKESQEEVVVIDHNQYQEEPQTLHQTSSYQPRNKKIEKLKSRPISWDLESLVVDASDLNGSSFDDYVLVENESSNNNNNNNNNSNNSNNTTIQNNNSTNRSALENIGDLENAEIPPSFDLNGIDLDQFNFSYDNNSNNDGDDDKNNKKSPKESTKKHKKTIQNEPGCIQTNTSDDTNKEESDAECASDTLQYDLSGIDMDQLNFVLDYSSLSNSYKEKKSKKKKKIKQNQDSMNNNNDNDNDNQGPDNNNNNNNNNNLASDIFGEDINKHLMDLNFDMPSYTGNDEPETQNTSSSKIVAAPSSNVQSSHAAPLSYDDFMAALSAPAPKSKTISLAPSYDLLSGIGLREDMNRKGMKKIKKRSITTGKKKGVYQMEDKNYIGYPFCGDKDIGLLAVFDGHAEKEAAEKATIYFPDILSSLLEEYKLSENSNLILRELFLQADKKLIEFETEGTTATAALFWKHNGTKYLQCANAGDSTVFLCRKGKAIALSVDHKVDNPSEIQRMQESGMIINKNQNRINGLALSRTLGDHFIKEKFPCVTANPYISPLYKIEEGDSHLILASDGLWDVVTGQRAYELIKDLTDPQDMASKLLNFALNSGKCTDNITVIVVTL